MTRHFVVLFSLLVAVLIEARHLEKRQARPFGQNNNNNGGNCQQGGTGTYANSNDCSTYFECGDGGAVLKQCGPGTEYNDATSSCDWPSANPGNCQRTANQNIKQELANLCGPNPSGNQSQAFLQPHPQICNAFFACSPNLLHNPCYFCGEGLYFPQGGSTCSANPDQSPQQFCQGGRRYVAHRDITRMTISNECSIYVEGNGRGGGFGGGQGNGRGGGFGGQGNGRGGGFGQNQGGGQGGFGQNQGGGQGNGQGWGF